MSGESVQLFLDGRLVEASRGTPLAGLIAERDPALAEALAAGRAYLTDAVGRLADPALPVEAGLIVRVVRSAPRAGP